MAALAQCCERFLSAGKQGADLAVIRLDIEASIALAQGLQPLSELVGVESAQGLGESEANDVAHRSDGQGGQALGRNGPLHGEDDMSEGIAERDMSRKRKQRGSHSSI